MPRGARLVLAASYPKRFQSPVVRGLAAGASVAVAEGEADGVAEGAAWRAGSCEPPHPASARAAISAASGTREAKGMAYPGWQAGSAVVAARGVQVAGVLAA